MSFAVYLWQDQSLLCLLCSPANFHQCLPNTHVLLAYVVPPNVVWWLMSFQSFVEYLWKYCKLCWVSYSVPLKGQRFQTLIKILLSIIPLKGQKFWNFLKILSTYTWVVQRILSLLSVPTKSVHLVNDGWYWKF